MDHCPPPIARLLRARKERHRAALLAALPTGGVGAELGVYRGDFSARMLGIAAPRRLHLIDPWRYEIADTYRGTVYGGRRGVSQAFMDAMHDAVLHRFAAEIAAGRVVVHRAASAETSALFPDEYFDWIYIDGNHLYEFVRRDLELYHTKVKRGGLIAGDDYHRGGWWKGGVKRAVDEFFATGRCEQVAAGGRQFLLRRR